MTKTAFTDKTGEPLYAGDIVIIVKLDRETF